MQEKHWNFIQGESGFFIVADVDPSIGKRSKSSYILWSLSSNDCYVIVMLERKGWGLPHFIYSKKMWMVECKCLKKTMNVGYILSLVLNILNFFAHRCKEREIKKLIYLQNLQKLTFHVIQPHTLFYFMSTFYEHLISTEG